MTNLLNKYRDHFKDIESLYDYQAEVLELLQKQLNTLAIIPTGGGKSLLYQLMALNLDGITLVLSPLLAIMKEQVEELVSKRNVPALAFNSEIPFNKQREILKKLDKLNYKIIYLSPERLQNYLFRASLIASKVKISMLVIDEAHCISQWGSNFRPEYSQIPNFIKWLRKNGQSPFTLSLTATLAIKPRNDIIKSFNVKKCYISEKIIRENLQLNFVKVKKETEKINILDSFIRKNKLQKVIAYLYSRRECENYAEQFQEKGYKTAYYHSSVSPEEKDVLYHDFLNGSIDILFSTTAFGMGVNLPDIDSVIHVHIPNSIEEYYQQVGRGWRDKKVHKICKCLTIWSETNFERRISEIQREKNTIDDIFLSYKRILGSAKIKRKGQIISKYKETLLISRENLQILRYKLEEKKVIETVGEINGTPQTIKLKKITPMWKKVVEASKNDDSFIYVSEKLNVSIKEIINHLYEQELLDNIDYVPAMKRQVFFKVNHKELPQKTAAQLMKEINKHIDQRIVQLNSLKKLFMSKKPERIIRATLKQPL